MLIQLLHIKHVYAEYVYLLLPNNILQHKYFAVRGNERACTQWTNKRGQQLPSLR
jgi:hypothetical protein